MGTNLSKLDSKKQFSTSRQSFIVTKVKIISSLSFFSVQDVEGLEIARLTSAFVKNVPEVEALGTEYGVEVSEFPFNGTGEPLEEAYQEAFAMDPPLGLIPECKRFRSKIRFFRHSKLIFALSSSCGRF